MNTEEILRTTAHRPFPLPAGPWVMTQIWHHLLFANWPLPPEMVRPLVPSQLSLDTFEGQAWISIVPFYMTYVRPRGVPSVPGISRFPELNVRTYVSLQGIPGVYFFSLDAGSALVVAAARFMTYLPYFQARMEYRLLGDMMYYRSHRTHSGAPSADFVAAYRPTSAASSTKAGTLDYWLTERYCLYSITRKEHIFRLHIHHRPWSLQLADAELELNTMASASNIPLPSPVERPLLRYAQRQEVLIWPPEVVAPANSAPQETAGEIPPGL
ncbi:DUF2071 domain-containing protein [Ktedonosporobacter rubrisoli]|uniref:DUF2071 domain-containing protein n=1 Tax=Ktedonosporobacter rubrisoli TaxID=2509675 RepID=A0A4P6JMP9_KTERU|nr:DUF2071 domain-containing protein [Ktedonosporobacter rubrisoli]QBD76525.1 DUF2071 domain-containing protein [Ktedonosporobacter rubrisoli]